MEEPVFLQLGSQNWVYLHRGIDPTETLVDKQYREYKAKGSATSFLPTQLSFERAKPLSFIY